MFMTRPFLQSLSPAPRFIIRAQVFVRCTDFRELTPFSARPTRGKQGCFIYLLIYSFCPSSRQIWHHREPRHTRRHAHISYPLFPDHNEVVSLILSLFYPQNQHTHTYAYTHGHPQRSVCKLHHRPSSLELYRAFSYFDIATTAVGKYSGSAVKRLRGYGRKRNSDRGTKKKSSRQSIRFLTIFCPKTSHFLLRWVVYRKKRLFYRSSTGARDQVTDRYTTVLFIGLRVCVCVCVLVLLCLSMNASGENPLFIAIFTWQVNNKSLHLFSSQSSAKQHLLLSPSERTETIW